ncbi:hypothetical protein RLOC_00002806 [Lonchura striata]|uniref:Uncharacterized protein n=1 Tax=Lonchura striata TaxID=40157 RepID=A0A218U6Q5_9PASE|nr:hypothetical protein RLOC_00002806 [Lonchura striata domestica]
MPGVAVTALYWDHTGSSSWLCLLFMSPLSLVCGSPWIPKLSLSTPSAPPNLHVPPVLHSRHFLEVALSEPSLRVPQSLIVGDVHGSPCEHCGSKQGRMEPQTLGMGAGAELGHWDSQRPSLRTGTGPWPTVTWRRGQYNQSGGSLHTLQVVSSCDLLSNRASVDPMGTATRAEISSPSNCDLGALQCPTVPPGSPRGAGNPKGSWWSR